MSGGFAFDDRFKMRTLPLYEEAVGKKYELNRHGLHSFANEISL
jgi:hypothetical protein